MKLKFTVHVGNCNNMNTALIMCHHVQSINSSWIFMSINPQWETSLPHKHSMRITSDTHTHTLTEESEHTRGLKSLCWMFSLIRSVSSWITLFRMNHLIIDFSVCARVVAMWVDSFLCMHLSVSVCVCVYLARINNSGKCQSVKNGHHLSSLSSYWFNLQPFATCCQICLHKTHLRTMPSTWVLFACLSEIGPNNHGRISEYFLRE